MSWLDGVTTYKETSYQTLEDLVDNSYVELSTFGYCNVYSLNQEGCITVEGLIKKISQLVESNPHFSETERELGKKIEKKISKLVNIAIEQQNHANFITKIFMFFVNFMSIIEGNSLTNAWHEDMPSFDYYTKEQYKKVFNKEIDQNEKSAGTIGTGHNMINVYNV